MVVVYLGIVLGGAFGLSCCCTAFWVGVNRKRGRLREYPKRQDSSDDSDDSDVEDVAGATEEGDEEEGPDEGDEGYEEGRSIDSGSIVFFDDTTITV